MRILSKKITVITLLFTLFCAFGITYAQDGEQAFTQSAETHTREYMKQAQEEATLTLAELKSRIQNIPRNDARRQEALDLIGNALGKNKTGLEKEVADFAAGTYGVNITPAIGDALPLVEPDSEFQLQYEKVQQGFAEVNQILLAPARPGEVPTGDVVQDFIPQLIRQFFRFAWVAVFAAFIVSGVMFVMAFGNDERVDKAKKMTYMSIVGFILVALAFAVVSAITDIDFFRFI